MAHFALIENNTVVQVVVVPDSEETRGNDYLNELGLIGEWVQCSYNGTIRGLFPGHGYKYDRYLDTFISPIDEEIKEST